MKALSINQVEAASVLASLSTAEESLLAGGASHFTSEVFFSSESGLSSSASFSIDGASSISIIADGISVDDIGIDGAKGKFTYLSKVSMCVRKGARSRKKKFVGSFSL